MHDMTDPVESCTDSAAVARLTSYRRRRHCYCRWCRNEFLFCWKLWI